MGNQTILTFYVILLLHFSILARSSVYLLLLIQIQTPWPPSMLQQA